MNFSKQQFMHTCLRALIRAEADGRVPKRFTGDGPAIWHTFRNELTIADLVTLAIEDMGVLMPIPFKPTDWWPDWPDWALLNQPETAVQSWLDAARGEIGQSQQHYLRTQAQLLELSLPEDALFIDLPTPASFEQCLELPGTGGWIAYHLCRRPDVALYFWENFHILCGTPQEMLFAGLIAWELGAPSNRLLPIHLDDPDLTRTLQSGKQYDSVVGLHTRHGHRNLKILQREKGSIWLL